MGVLDNITALRSGFDLGQQVFGQDQASKELALRERSLGLESALRVKQLEDSQAYQQGQLANDWERNRISEEDAVRRDKMTGRELGLRRYLGDQTVAVQREGQGITSRHYDTQAELEREKNRIMEDYHKGVLTQQQAELEVRRLDSENMRGYRNALTGQTNAQTQKLEDELGRRKAFDQGKAAFFKALQDGPYSLPEGSDRDRVMTMLSLAGSPTLKADADLIHSMKPGEKPSPEALGAVQRVMQPWVDKNLGLVDGKGHKVIAGGTLQRIEPDPSGDGTYNAIISARKQAPDGSTYDDEYVLTQGRKPMDQGGVPLKIKPDDIANTAFGIRRLAEFGELNPEAAAELRDMQEAMAASSDEDSFQKYMYETKKAKYRAAKDEAKLKTLDAKETSRLRSSLENGLSKELDVRAGFNPKLMQDLSSGALNAEDAQRQGIDVKAVQQYQQDKAALMDRIRRGMLTDAPLDQMQRMSPGDVLDVINNDEGMKPYMDKVLRSALPPKAPTEKEPPRTSGGIYNPRSHSGSSYPSSYPKAAGGQPSPLAQAAPDAGGILKSHLLHGKSQEHLTGLRGPFADRLAAMLRDAPGPVSIYSGYRSPQRQAQIFAGSDHSGHRVAHPGHSNHNHGIAADLKYASPAVRRWVHENAARYGLAFRMPWEPWHIEPAGAGPDARNWGI